MQGTLPRDFETESRASTGDHDDFAGQVRDRRMVEVTWIKVINKPFHIVDRVEQD